MLAGIGKQTGLSYFNGKQTPIILMVMSKMDPTIAEIFKAGYTATKSGLNPGLDAMETATGAEEPITTPGQKEPATDAQTTP